MFGFIKKIFTTTIAFIELNGYDSSLSNAMKCVSMNNQECKVRSAMVNINSAFFSNENSNEPFFIPTTFFVNKCSGSCNNIKDLYGKVCDFEE